MAWLLPDSETPVDIRPAKPNVIDLRDVEPVAAAPEARPTPDQAGIDSFEQALADLQARQAADAEAQRQTELQASVDRGKALLDEEQRQATESANRSKEAIDAQLARGKEGVENPASEQERKLIEETRAEFAGVRTVDELRERAKALAEPGGFLIEDPSTGWFKAAESADPGESKLPAKIVMNELNAMRVDLDKRGKLEKARAALSYHSERMDERNEAAGKAKAEEKAERSRLKSERKAEEAHDEMLEEAYSELRAFDETADMVAAAEARASAYGDKDSFDKYVDAKMDEVSKPFNEEIARLNKQKEAVDNLTGRFLRSEKVKDKLKADLDDEIKAQKKLRKAARKEAQKAAEKESEKLETEAAAHTKKALEFVTKTNPEPLEFRPKPGEDPDRALAVTGAVDELLGKKTESSGKPFQVDEYMLGKTRMQRLVYKTNTENVLIIEEWDKTAGILKRQTVMKGSDLLVKDYENDGVSARKARKLEKAGDYRMVLSDAKYGELDQTTVDQVAGDSDTSYESGSMAYATRLHRSGAGLGGSFEMAAGGYKPKKNKGFIAMLQENMGGSKRKYKA